MVWRIFRLPGICYFGTRQRRKVAACAGRKAGRQAGLCLTHFFFRSDLPLQFVEKSKFVICSSPRCFWDSRRVPWILEQTFAWSRTAQNQRQCAVQCVRGVQHSARAKRSVSLAVLKVQKHQNTPEHTRMHQNAPEWKFHFSELAKTGWTIGGLNFTLISNLKSK